MFGFYLHEWCITWTRQFDLKVMSFERGVKVIVYVSLNINHNIYHDTNHDIKPRNQYIEAFLIKIYIWWELCGIVFTQYILIGD